MWRQWLSQFPCNGIPICPGSMFYGPGCQICHPRSRGLELYFCRNAIDRTTTVPVQSAILVEYRVMGHSRKYFFHIPANTCKDYLPQLVFDVRGNMWVLMSSLLLHLFMQSRIIKVSANYAAQNQKSNQNLMTNRKWRRFFSLLGLEVRHADRPWEFVLLIELHCPACHWY